MMPFVYRCRKCGSLQESNDPPSVIHFCYNCGVIDVPLHSVDLDFLKPQGVIKLLEMDIRRRNLGRKPKVKLFWTDRTGVKTEVSKMTRLHVENIIRRVKKFIN